MIATPDAARHARASRLDRARIDDIVEQLTQRGLSVSCQLSLATDLVRECEALLSVIERSQVSEATSTPMTSPECTHVRGKKFLSTRIRNPLSSWEAPKLTQTRSPEQK